MNIPSDAYMLLSIINTNLRDYFDSLDTFCESNDVDKKGIEEKLYSIGYVYVKEENQFKQR